MHFGEKKRTLGPPNIESGNKILEHKLEVGAWPNVKNVNYWNKQP